MQPLALHMARTGGEAPSEKRQPLCSRSVRLYVAQADTASIFDSCQGKDPKKDAQTPILLLMFLLQTVVLFISGCEFQARKVAVPSRTASCLQTLL